MPIYVVTINYVKPMDVVEAHTPDHRTYSADLADTGVLLASGPFAPRTGGMLVMQAESRDALDEIVGRDPFKINAIAEYDVREWVPKIGVERFA